MRVFRFARWLALALLVSLIPATSHAGVFISVGFAPPPLPVYVQPVCPEPNLIWTPGYWAYGPEGYYWVPGAWVPAPYVGALWTPGYWGWGSGFYVWHPGYWGPHVGYYGGINYGFGYFGIGFVGGMWHGGVFAYNTAVMRVDTRVIRNVYVNRAIVSRYTVAPGSHVAYSGGRGGINHLPTPEERAAEHEQHMARTSFQTQHAEAAMRDHNAYARFNGGRPQNLAASRPLGRETRPRNESRPAQQFRQAPQREYRQQQGRTQEYRQQPQQRYQEQRRSEPQRAAPQGHGESRPQRGESRPQHEDHPHR